MVVEDVNGFERGWAAEVLQTRPMIAPVRQFTYPQRVAGEEEAMARGALEVLVRPRAGGQFLATCALGFKSESVPSGVFGCPRAEEMCAVAGGYAYVIDTIAPETAHFMSLRPVVEVVILRDFGLLVFVGFHGMVAWGVNGQGWETGRLSWEGVRVSGVEGGVLCGFGWDMQTDREVAFSVDLGTGAHEGGGYRL